MALHTGQHQIEDVATNIVYSLSARFKHSQFTRVHTEVNLDEALGLLDEILLKRVLLVVNADVRTQPLNPAALVVCTGNTDDLLVHQSASVRRIRVNAG